MRVPARVSRRRALQIVAGAGSLAGVAALRGSVPESTKLLHTWRGIALGARVSITLAHHDAAEARRLLRLCVAEVERLENAFSLYRRRSAISQLNRQGYLLSPPPDLVRLLATARVFAELTDGAFDPTVQPLWNLYANHFAQASRRLGGPDGSAITKTTALVNYQKLSVAAAEVGFQRSGMAITLNGVAQGYITDRVTELLRNEGLDHVLVDLGEIRALGRHGNGRPWTVGLADPLVTGQVVETVNLENRAVACSAGLATRFDEGGGHHHLFDPHTGASASRYLSVTVIAPTATMADALSTGFASMDPGHIEKVLQHLRAVTVRLTSSPGHVATLST